MYLGEDYAHSVAIKKTFHTVFDIITEQGESVCTHITMYY